MLIIASAGIHTVKRKNLAKMILAGTDIVRVNISRHSLEQSLLLISEVKKVIEELHANTKIMLDLSLYKYRLGDFEDKHLDVKEYQELIFRTADYSSSGYEFIPVKVSQLGKKVRLHQIITIGDGEIAVQVIEIINNESVKMRILNTGTLVYFKTFNITPDYSSENKENILRLYEEIIGKIAVHEPDYVAIPYHNEDINEKIKGLPVWQNGGFFKTKLIARVETAEAVQEAEKFFRNPAYSMVLLSRGNIGTILPFEQMGIIQNQIIALSHKYKKPMLVSTQILESTINNHTPSRAEISDLTYLVTQRVDGIVFRRETGLNNRPAYTISVAKKIIEATEKYLDRREPDK